jgi:hypothetical protein
MDFECLLTISPLGMSFFFFLGVWLGGLIFSQFFTITFVPASAFHPLLLPDHSDCENKVVNAVVEEMGKGMRQHLAY